MSIRKHARLLKELNELREELVRCGSPARCATFQEVEEWAGSPLPASAYKHRAWWSNNDGNYSNSLKPWDLARLNTAEVDMAAKTLVFRLWPKDAELARRNQPPFKRPAFLEKAKHPHAVSQQQGFEEVAQPYQTQASGHHPLRGALKGKLRIVGGTDLTKPADPEWGDAS